MDSYITLREKFTISEEYDKAEVFSSILQRVGGVNSPTVQRAALFTLWPFREENGVKIFSPAEKRLSLQIDDLDKPLQDPLLEDLRQKAKQADDLLIMGVTVVKGVAGS